MPNDGIKGKDKSPQKSPGAAFDPEASGLPAVPGRSSCSVSFAQGPPGIKHRPGHGAWAAHLSRAEPWSQSRAKCFVFGHPSRAVLASRNPLLLFLLFRSFLLRLAARQLLSLLFHEPPRKTAFGAMPETKVVFFKNFSASPNEKKKKEKKGKG